MKIHQIKIDYEFYLSVERGIKTFELRKDDRNYKEGDFINFIIVKGKELIYTYPIYRITYKLTRYKGLQKGYCILCIIPTGKLCDGDFKYED